MKVQRTLGSAKPTLESIQRWIENIAKIFAANVSFGATMSNSDQDMNMNVWKASGTSPSGANTEFSIVHQLGRIPITIVGQDTKDGSVLYRSSTTWTATTVFLKSTGASTVYNVIIA